MHIPDKSPRDWSSEKLKLCFQPWLSYRSYTCITFQWRHLVGIFQQIWISYSGMSMYDMRPKPKFTALKRIIINSNENIQLLNDAKYCWYFSKKASPESAKDRQCLKADLHIYIPPLYRTDYRVCDRLE